MKSVVDPSAGRPLSARRLNVALLCALALALVFLALCAWLTDFFSLQGERIVYTADCTGGAWVGDRCSGAVHAGDRYRFHAFRDRREVTFKRVGSADEETRMTNCSVLSGRDWSCGADGQAVKSIVSTMVRGEGVAEPAQASRSVRCVSKARWLVLAATTRKGDLKGQ